MNERVYPEGKPDELTWHAHAVERGIIKLAEYAALGGLLLAIWAAGGADAGATADTAGYPTPGSTKTVSITQPDGTVIKVPLIPEQHAPDVYQQQTENAYERVQTNVGQAEYTSQEELTQANEQQGYASQIGYESYKTEVTGGLTGGQEVGQGGGGGGGGGYTPQPTIPMITPGGGTTSVLTQQLAAGSGVGQGTVSIPIVTATSNTYAT